MIDDLKAPLFGVSAQSVAHAAARDRETTGRAAIAVLDGSALYLGAEYGSQAIAERLYQLAD